MGQILRRQTAPSPPPSSAATPPSSPPPTTPALVVDDEAGPRDPPTPRYGLPKPAGYSLSHWLKSVESDPLLHHRSTPALPSAADVVVIGSGLTGTLVAQHCLATWPGKSVVVLEARMFCSGATGRNAGHCKPDQYRGFARYEAAFGTVQALKILQNEQRTWEALVRYVRENDVECELWVGDTLDVPLDGEVEDLTRETFERYREAGGQVGHIGVVTDAEEAEKRTHLKAARGAYAWPASTLHPWKLAAHIMRGNLSAGVNLQTHTVVTAVTPSLDSPGAWLVETSRGSITAPAVVHATNAYSPALEPLLRGAIAPTPHICTQVRAPPDTNPLTNSYGVLLGGGAMFSVNPRPGDGGVLFGGSNPGQAAFARWLEAHPERCVDDGIEGWPAVVDAVKEFVGSGWEGWDGEVVANWSGIIARSADGVPFVGALPGKPGQWVCAGHNGHGMARIFTAAPALVQLMAGGSWAETELPDVYQITAERIEALKKRKAGQDDRE